MKTQHGRDLDEFFSFILNDSLSSSEYIKYFYGYHGLLNFGHQSLFYSKLIEKFEREGDLDHSSLCHEQVFGRGAQLQKTLLQESLLGERHDYPNMLEVNTLTETTLRPSSRNEWQCERLPSPFNMRMKLPNRLALKMYSSTGHKLFVSPYGYQYYEPTENICWPDASSRVFGRLDGLYPTKHVDDIVVVVQDQFDGSNFSHFLYDYVPRVIYYCELYPDDCRRAVFLLGGIRGPFQGLLVQALCAKYDLLERQFVFPVGREIWSLSTKIHFFSDQTTSISHPMGICHPAVVRLIRDLIDDLGLDDEGRVKIYIKRNAKDFRRIRNDDQVLKVTRSLGFQTVDLSSMEIKKQLALVTSAISIIGAHGMGFTGIVGSKRLGRIVELFNPVIGSDAYSLVSSALGLDYNFLIGSGSLEDDLMSYVVDPDLVRSAIR